MYVYIVKNTDRSKPTAYENTSKVSFVRDYKSKDNKFHNIFHNC